MCLFFPPSLCPPLHPQSPLSIQRWRVILLEETQRSAHGKPNRRNSSLTCRSSSADGQQEPFPHDFTLSFPHFSPPPTFSTLFPGPPLGSSIPLPVSPSSFLHLSPPLLFPRSCPLFLSFPEPLCSARCLHVAFLWFPTPFSPPFPPSAPGGRFILPLSPHLEQTCPRLPRIHGVFLAHCFSCSNVTMLSVI